ncbi:MAG: T9SS type A sorting domain-containing protein [Flavobacteriales bacterium]|nr:T9SS type A sorting domain-containing protein [Flavobacteriales bacterium]
MAIALGTGAFAQTTFPLTPSEHDIQNVNWTSGVHLEHFPQPIVAPGDPSSPVSISDLAYAEFVSGTEVELTGGFYAGDFSGNESFIAKIDQELGTPEDVVVIAPNPATHLIDNVVHVEKWEKLEIGFKLPPAYQQAIDRFFNHYYSNGVTSDATPGNVDAVHDLNPYADDSLQLVIMLTSPSNAQRMKFGFYMKKGMWASTSPLAKLTADTTGPLVPYHVHFRFTPDEEGPWQFSISIKAPHTENLYDYPLQPLMFSSYSFVCDSPLPDNHGPLHMNATNRRTLQFEDSTAFFGLGTNLAGAHHGNFGASIDTNSYWYSNYQRDYQVMGQAMGTLHDVGGNYMRMWLDRHLAAPEYVNLGVYDAYLTPPVCDSAESTDEPCDVGYTKGYAANCQYQCWAFDSLLEQAHANDLYIQLCIESNYPGNDGEKLSWGANPYVIHYLDAYRDNEWPGWPTNPYDVKMFFYKNGDPQYKNEGVFYYWKRRYKYIMARWGYSVNIASIEPFNEVDQMLTYQQMPNGLGTNNAPFNSCNSYYAANIASRGICRENRGPWQKDPLLPGTINQWLTDIMAFVRDPVDTAHPATSPLGEDKKLFLMSYTDRYQPGNEPPGFFQPFNNPKLDIIDVHRGLYWGEGEVSNSFDLDQNFRDNFHPGGLKKPFHNGEYNTYALRSDTSDLNIGHEYNTGKIFDNYDVSFHNEIWASTFFGNFAAGTSWAWERVFWWPDALPVPPPENITQNPFNPIHTNILGAHNILNPNGEPVQVRNRTTYHIFKPLSNFLTNPNLQAYNFFGGDFVPHKVFDDGNKIEVYYLTDSSNTMAIGWVHNLNAYWEKHYYVKNDPTLQNFFGCTAPDTQKVSISGLQPGADYHITWFPTRMNDTIHPADAVDTSGTGTVLLDMSTAPLGDTLNLYLDTLHTDYGFIIALQPVLRGMQVPIDTVLEVSQHEWDYYLYPNPTRNQVSLVLPDDAVVDIAIYDLSGRRLQLWSNLQGPQVQIPTNQLAQGAYLVQVATGVNSRTKPLIIR